MPETVQFEEVKLKNLSNRESFSDAMATIRVMITMAIGTVKELKSQAHEKYKVPGMRFLIGEVLSLLGTAHKATTITPEELNFKKL